MFSMLNENFFVTCKVKMHIPTAAKVMGRVIITRIRDGINQQLRDEQAGYRSGRSTTEQIFVLRNIIEQVIEWNSCLYLYRL